MAVATSASVPPPTATDVVVEPRVTVTDGPATTVSVVGTLVAVVTPWPWARWSTVKDNAPTAAVDVAVTVAMAGSLVVATRASHPATRCSGVAASVIFARLDSIDFSELSAVAALVRLASIWSRGTRSRSINCLMIVVVSRPLTRPSIGIATVPFGMTNGLGRHEDAPGRMGGEVG